MPHMAPLYDKVRARLDEMSPVLSDRAASIKATNNRNPDLIRALKRGRANAPRGDNLVGLAKLLGRPIEWFFEVETLDTTKPNTRPAEVQLPHRQVMPRDIPVLGTAAASMLGTGKPQLPSDAVDWVARPPGLATSRDIYARYIEGDSMTPCFHPGNLVFVSPHKPIRVNDVVIIEEPLSNNGKPRWSIKLFLRKTEASIFTRQLNPNSNIEFVRAPGTLIHKVLTMNELFGL